MGINLRMERVLRCVPPSQRLWVAQEYVVFLQFSPHQKYQAVLLGPHRRITSSSFLSLMTLGTIVAVDFLIHVICRILPSHHHRFAR